MYSYKHSLRRQHGRSDLSPYVVHLTKSHINNHNEETMTPLESLINILISKTISCNDKPAVCFTEAPLYAIAEEVVYLHAKRMDKIYFERMPIPHFTGYGVAFDRRYAYTNGTRHALYMKKEEANQVLKKSEHWRVVDTNLDDEKNVKDFSYQREWCKKGDFQFDLTETVIILPTNKQYDQFVHLEPKLANEVLDIVVLEDIYPSVYLDLEWFPKINWDTKELARCLQLIEEHKYDR